jgi:prepilin-type N-terminal cleavage/methylation domain-containing protein
MDTQSYGIRIREALANQRGFTLAELMAAIVIIGIGLVAVGAGFDTAIQGIETGRQQTTATFLAEQRMEQVKAAALGNSLTACIPAQAYASIPNAPGYRSTVTVTDYLVAGSIARKRVDVEVFYRPVVAWGVLNTAERSVRISTLITNHT